MDISCDIIRDLLPLYAENLVSEDSRKLVDDHLCTCDPCTKQLGILKKATAIPIEVETKSLKRVENTLRRRRVLTVAAALMTALAVLVSGIVFMTAPVFLTAEQAIEGVELREDGGLAIDYAHGITGRASYALNDEVTHRGVICHTTRYDWFVSKAQEKNWKSLSTEELEAYILERYEAEEMTDKLWDRFHNVTVEYGTWTLLDGDYLHVYDPEVWIEGNGQWTFRESEISQWYLDVQTGKPETLLWDGGGQNAAESWIDPFYGYAIAFFGSIAMAVVLFILSRRTLDRKQEVLIRLSIICISIAFSVLLVTGGNLVIGEAWIYEWKNPVVAESVAVAMTLLFWHQLHLMNKQDRGM